MSTVFQAAGWISTFTVQPGQLSYEEEDPTDVEIGLLNADELGEQVE